MPERRFALLIGTAEYDDPQLARLEGPPHDLEGLARVLQAHGDFVVQTVLNYTADDLRAAIADFFAEKKRDDLLLLYFSGHGLTHGDDGALYLAAKNTTKQRPSARGVPAQFITQEMDNNHLRRVVLVLDCCYSGAFARTKGEADLGKVFNSGYGRVVLTAASPTEEAWEGRPVLGQTGCSLFTHFLIEGIESGAATPNETITADDWYAYAEKCVTNLPKPKPQTPRKWVDNQQGEPIIIARNPRYIRTAPVALNQHFICYSAMDGAEYAHALRAALPNAWLDAQDTPEGYDPNSACENALRDCASVIFVATPASQKPTSDAQAELKKALKFKKPIFPVQTAPGGEMPLLLGNRAAITGTPDKTAAELSRLVSELNKPAGQLRELEYRLSDAERELRTARDEQRQRVLQDIAQLEGEIRTQREVVRDPQAAARTTEARIEAGLERERKPEKPTAAQSSTKFINQPPSEEQKYFQDRLVETEQVILFLKNNAQRLMTIVGRGGAGKTAMTCRLLKHIENGTLPDNFVEKHGKINADGIVYLSETGSRKLSFANLFADLCRLLPADISSNLDAIYRNPQTSTDEKMHKLLEALPSEGRIILLLDNFENVVDTEAQNITDSELDEALCAILHAPHHSLKVIITTRMAPEKLGLYEPARQRLLPLDSGLAPKYAKEAFLLMDEGDLVGIKNSDEKLLDLMVERTLGLPRALEALYAALRSDRYTKLEELIALPVLPENVVSAYVGEAFNRLDTNAQKVMQALAVYNRPVTPAAVDYLLAPHLPAIDSAPILQRLANMHFARKESGRFYLHPVDREFAISLLPEGNIDDKVRSGSGLELLQYFGEKVQSQYPDLFGNFEDLKSKKGKEAFQEIAKTENPDLIRDLATGLQNLAPDLLQKMQDPNNYGDENFLRTIDQSLQIPQVWTRYALTFRAADYFKQARKPRAEWKKLEDLTAQLAEFELRCAAGDYDTAASILVDIDGECLLAWGHYRLTIQLHEKLRGKVHDKALEMFGVARLGGAHFYTGKIKEFIECEELALAIAREIKDRFNECDWLCNLGSAYSILGNLYKAIEFYEQALIVAREISNKKTEGAILSNLAGQYSDLARYDISITYYNQALENARELGNKYGESKRLNGLARILIEKRDFKSAISHFLESFQIGQEISNPEVCSGSGISLAEAYFLQNDLVNARATIQATLQYDVPENNHNASALYGIIALRQGDDVAAREAFVRAIGQADEILSKTAEFYSALDAKGLSLAGLTILDLRLPNDDGRQTAVGGQSSAVHAQQAIDAFRKARQIAPHAGVVKSVLRLFDELAKCDTTGLLAPVRAAAAGE
jgi:tetratricopeptide (TPR) repeat protein